MLGELLRPLFRQIAIEPSGDTLLGSSAVKHWPRELLAGIERARLIRARAKCGCSNLPWMCARLRFARKLHQRGRLHPMQPDRRRLRPSRGGVFRIAPVARLALPCSCICCS